MTRANVEGMSQRQVVAAIVFCKPLRKWRSEMVELCHSQKVLVTIDSIPVVNLKG